MSKKLRREPIYIAPEIIGWLDENYNPVVKDERKNRQLDPRNIDDKIIIYERQVKDWFLKPATRYLRGRNNGFIVLMICLSYLEGVEQYKRGQTSNNRSREFFTSSINRLYPNVHSQNDLNDFYREARCGLFHNGMVRGKIIINYSFEHPIHFDNPRTIKVNPKMLLNDIKNDFKQYIELLKSDNQSRTNFDNLYSNI